MLSETEFHAYADQTLNLLEESLEDADASGALDMELSGGILTLTLPGGRQYLVSKHATNRELWVSSPLSGGLHFRWQDGWKLPDGREIAALVALELEQLAGIQAA